MGHVFRMIGTCVQNDCQSTPLVICDFEHRADHRLLCSKYIRVIPLFLECRSRSVSIKRDILFVRMEFGLGRVGSYHQIKSETIWFRFGRMTGEGCGQRQLETGSFVNRQATNSGWGL